MSSDFHRAGGLHFAFHYLFQTDSGLGYQSNIVDVAECPVRERVLATRCFIMPTLGQMVANRRGPQATERISSTMPSSTTPFPSCRVDRTPPLRLATALSSYTRKWIPPSRRPCWSHLSCCLRWPFAKPISTPSHTGYPSADTLVLPDIVLQKPSFSHRRRRNIGINRRRCVDTSASQK